MAVFFWSRLPLASFCITYRKVSCEKAEGPYRRIFITRTLSSSEEYAEKNKVFKCFDMKKHTKHLFLASLCRKT